MKRNISSLYGISLQVLVFTLVASSSLAQTEEELKFIEAAESDSSGYFTVILFLLAGVGAAVYFWKKSKKNNPQPQYNYENRLKNSSSTNGTSKMGGVDTSDELEGLRKAKNSKSKVPAMGYKKVSPARAASVEDTSFETKAFQERMRKLQYAQLPINSFSELSRSKVYEPLPLSSDEGLINAIEQANDEFEEDENVRGLAC